MFGLGAENDQTTNLRYSFWDLCCIGRPALSGGMDWWCMEWHVRESINVFQRQSAEICRKIPKYRRKSDFCQMSLGRAIHGPIPASRESFDQLSASLVQTDFPWKQGSKGLVHTDLRKNLKGNNYRAKSFFSHLFRIFPPGLSPLKQRV